MMADETLVSTAEAAAELEAELGANPEDSPEEPSAKTDVRAEEPDGDEPAAAKSDDSPSEQVDTDLDEVKSFIQDRYRGDAKAFLRSLQERDNAASREAKRLERVEAALNRITEAMAADAEDEDEMPEGFDPAQDPELQRIEGEAQEIASNIKENANERQMLLQTIAKSEKKVARLEGKLEVTLDDADAASLRQEIREEKQEIERASREWKNLGKEEKTLLRDLQALKDRRDRHVAQLEKAIQEHRQQLVDRRQFADKSAKDFDNAIESTAKALGIPEDRVDYMDSVIRAEFVRFARSQPKGTPPIDIAQFVKRRGEAFAVALGIRKSKPSAAPQRPGVGRPSVSGTPSKPQKPLDPREEAARIRQEAIDFFGG